MLKRAIQNTDVDREWPPGQARRRRRALALRAAEYLGGVVGAAITLLAVLLSLALLEATGGPGGFAETSAGRFALEFFNLVPPVLGSLSQPLLIVLVAYVLLRSLLRRAFRPEAEERRRARVRARLDEAGVGSAAIAGRFVSIDPVRERAAEAWKTVGEPDDGFLLLFPGWLQFYGERTRFALRPEQVVSVEVYPEERARLLDAPELRLIWRAAATGGEGALEVEPLDDGERRELREALCRELGAWRAAPPVREHPPPEAARARDGRVPLPPVVLPPPRPEWEWARTSLAWPMATSLFYFPLWALALRSYESWGWPATLGVLLVAVALAPLVQAAARPLIEDRVCWGRLTPPAPTPIPEEARAR